MLDLLPKWFRLARKESLKSDYKLKVGAVVIKGGSVVSSGHNNVRHQSIGNNKFTIWKESLHAERAALAKMNKDEIKGCSIYIYREFGNTGYPAFSKPCHQCAFMLSELGIKKVFYTISEAPYYKEIRL